MRKLYIILFFALSMIEIVKAEIYYNAGTTGAQFLNLETIPEAIAVAGNSVLTTGANSIFQNPAGLCKSNMREVSFIYNLKYENIGENLLAFSFPFKNYYVG
ncbi:hypothetical protein J7L85_03430, partial [candidate division WOR-3 bacterium]|nr:hypothetical protein [candidate division WOR-3 bacterium]